MVMALYVFEILSISGSLHDDARGKFKLWLEQWVTIAFGDSLRTYDAALFSETEYLQRNHNIDLSTQFNTNVIVKLNNGIPNCFSSYSFQFYKLHEYFTNLIVIIDISQADGQFFIVAGDNFVGRNRVNTAFGYFFY